MKEGAAKLLAKAERALGAAGKLLDSGDAEFAAGRVYYAMFYVAEALLYERGLAFGKHSAVHAAFGKEFAKSGLLDPKFHRWLLDAFDARLQTDYSFDVAVEAEAVQETVERAREFLAAVRSFLAATPGPEPTANGATTGPGAPGDSGPPASKPGGEP
jgi:uncharacterized protein (UPF0332 family)